MFSKEGIEIRKMYVRSSLITSNRVCDNASYIYALIKENLSSRVCEQQRNRPACATRVHTDWTK